MKRRILIFLACALALTSLLWLANSLQSSLVAEDTADSQARAGSRAGKVQHRLDTGGGVKARPVDPANESPPEWSGGRLELNAYRRLAEEPVAVRELLDHGDEKWLDFLVGLHDPALARGEWLSCRDTFISESNCAMRLTAVVEPANTDDGDLDGVIGYANVETGPDPAEGCREFAACLARGYIGKRVVLPPHKQPASFSRKVSGTKRRNMTLDQQRELIATLSADLQAVETDLREADLSKRFNGEVQRRLVEMLRGELRQREQQ